MTQVEITQNHNLFIINQFIIHLMKIGVINNPVKLEGYADKFIEDNKIPFINNRWEF